jgi:maleylpyruvate isomerase
MDAARRELDGQVDLATQRLLDDARILNEDDLRSPSLLPGWTRADVLWHVGQVADAMRNLLVSARTGQDSGVSGQAREGAPERAGSRTKADLVAYLADSAMALRIVGRQLPDEVWQAPLRVPDLAPFPAAELLTRRLTEVELHHCDLGTGYGPADWPAAFATMELAEPMRSQRQDRLARPQPAPDAAASSPARPAAPWRPGQRLPGSWIGPGAGGR